MSQKRRKYTAEFKAEAVKLSEKLGVSKSAQELGISADNIRKWVRSADPKGSAEILSPRDIEAENRRLRKEIEYLKKINEVLKKSTAIFSKDHIGDLR